MSWTPYRVILRLRSPMHIGWLTIGNLQRTRPYVTGRVLRGALVSRVARNQNVIGEKAGDPYRPVSKTFAQYLRFTYFYPALKDEEGHYRIQFPWDDETLFRRRFLGSYVSAALDYPQQTAAEGLLHEIEFISPYTLDERQPVYLMGYVFVQEQRIKYDWRGGFRRLQLGGERGYGWGDARLDQEPKMIAEKGKLFDSIPFEADQKYPLVHLKKGECLLAHFKVPSSLHTRLAGSIEPIVGREWRANNEEHPKHRHIGQHRAYDGITFAPGSVLQDEKASFIIGKGGYWLPTPSGVAT